jgi:DNA-binding transcriptional ArsR family regulator
MPRSNAQRKVDPAPLFAALGDRTRLSLVMQLSDGRARSISELSVGAQITRQAVTKHLQVLEDVGLVSSMKEGRESRYSYEPEAFKDMQEYLQFIGKQWENALGRLKDFVERD